MSRLPSVEQQEDGRLSLTLPASAGAEVRGAVLAKRTAIAVEEPRGERLHTARERAHRLCDTGSFVEIEALRRGHPTKEGVAPRDGDGVVVGWGLVTGRATVVVSHDFSYAGGSIGAAFAGKVTRAQRMAIERRCPIVYLNDSGGARVNEGIEALHGCGEIMALNVAARKTVPQISAILGPCAGAAAYSPALTDWTLMVSGRSQMFLTGPEVVRAATGEQVSLEDLGGVRLHTRESGVAHMEVPDEEAALLTVRRLLSYLPQTAGGSLPERLPAPPPPARAELLPMLVPAEPRASFDMRALLAGVLDAGVFFEVMAGVGQSLLTGFARLEGVPVGVVASQPARRGGILDARSAAKGARLVEFCGRFGLPILTFVDVPGFMPGSAEERRAVITHGASLLASYVEASVPKLTVIVRKAYGGAYIAMGSRSLGADLTLAWPTSEIAVMGPEAAVGLLRRRELADAEEPAAARAAFAAHYRETVTTPFAAAALGVIDDVILPEETRERLCAGLRLLLRPEGS